MVIYNTKDDPYLNVITGKNNAIKIRRYRDMLVGEVSLYPGSNAYYLKRNLTAGYVPSTLEEVIFLFDLWDDIFNKTRDVGDESKQKQKLILYIILMLVIKDKNAMFMKIKPMKSKASTSTATASSTTFETVEKIDSLAVIKDLVTNIRAALEERCDPSNDMTSYAISTILFGVFTGVTVTANLNASQLNAFNSTFTAALKLIDNYVRMPYLINDFIEALSANSSWVNQYNYSPSETDSDKLSLGKVSFLCNGVIV